MAMNVWCRTPRGEASVIAVQSAAWDANDIQGSVCDGVAAERLGMQKGLYRRNLMMILIMMVLVVLLVLLLLLVVVVLVLVLVLVLVVMIMTMAMMMMMMEESQEARHAREEIKVHDNRIGALIRTSSHERSHAERRRRDHRPIV
jgi:Ca2+/Na+ antiporter